MLRLVMFSVIVLISLTGCTNIMLDQACGMVNLKIDRSPEPLQIRDYERLDQAPGANRLREQAVTAYFTEHCPGVFLDRVNTRAGNNIICRLNGDSKKRIVVGAHFDQKGGGHGVADNWSGIVLITRLLSELSQKKLHYTWEFVAFAGEESDLQGSRAYVGRSLQEIRDGRIVAMINVDTLGLGPLKLDHRSDKYLQCLSERIALALDIKVTSTSLPSTTGDWYPFRQKGVPVLNLHSLDRQLIGKIHSRRDTRSVIDDVMLNDAWQILVTLQGLIDQSERY